MKHDYGHFSIPAPAIKDAVGATEDALGSIAVTHTLIGSLIGDLEGLQDIERRQMDAPGSVSPDAVNYRLEALSALAQAIDDRMKNDIILLEAVVHQQNQ